MNLRRELRTWGPVLLLLLPLALLANYQNPKVRQVRLDAKLIAAVHSHDEAAALDALRQGANPNVRDYYRPLPTLLIRLRHPDAAKEDDEIHAQEWEPVLTSAVLFGWEGTPNNLNDETVQALLLHGASINGQDYAGDRVLGYVTYQGRLDWVRELLKDKADAGSKNEALSSAVMAGQIAITRLLIAGGADVNQPNRFGILPLTTSCEQRRVAITRLLLQNGADPNLRDASGGDALQEALGARHRDIKMLAIIQLLEQYKAPRTTSTRKTRCPS